MRKLVAIFILLLISQVNAQEMTFTGVVNDTINDQPLSDAVVMAVKMPDYELLGFTRTKSDGSYELKGIEMDTMQLIISHYKFDEKSYYIIGSPENLEIHIPNVILPEKATHLEEVVVYANKDPIYFRGDTLVYQADSFATKKNAVVEDLLKNLPGLEVDDDGNISSQGRKVSKVLVDGDEFFGDDPTIATRNLGAEGVDKVEIYETEDEDKSGGNTEEKIQVMDVKLKDDYKTGYFGKVAGSGGFNTEYFRDEPNGSLFYEGEFLFNYFDKDLKVSVFGLGSNTPNTGFSYNDASRFGLTNEMDGQWFNFNRVSNLNGLPENYKGGFYFTDKLGKNKKVKLGVNYTFADSRIEQEQTRNAEHFFAADSTYLKLDSTRMYQKQQSHTINVNLDYDITSNTKLKLKSSLVLRNEKKTEKRFSDYLTSNHIRFSGNDMDNESTGKGLEGNVELKLQHKFEKRFRELEALYQFGYTESDRNNMLKSNIYFTDFALPDSVFNQKRNKDNHTTGHRVLLDYTEPITRQLRLKFQYRLDYFYGQQSTSTFNHTPTGYDDFAGLYSNDFSNDRLENRGAVGIYYTNRKHKIEGGTRLRNVLIENYNNVSEEAINQDVTNWLPYLEYTYKFSNSHQLYFSYSTNSSQPSLDQLQPVRDNTDPNSIVDGNPNLLPDYTHELQVRYNKWNAISQSYIYAGAYMYYIDNAFSNSIEYLPDGRARMQAINVDNTIYSGFYAGTGIPVFKKLFSVRPNVNGGYTSTYSEIEHELNATENYNIAGSLSLDMRSDTIEVSIGASYDYNYPKSTLSLGVNEPYLVQRYTASVYFELPFNFFIESDATYEINSQRAEGYNEKPFIWNVKLNKRLLKTENLELSVEVNDIFNQNIGISRNVGTNIVTDVRNRIIARYFMVGATWRFNNQNKKEDNERNRFF